MRMNTRRLAALVASLTALAAPPAELRRRARPPGEPAVGAPPVALARRAPDPDDRSRLGLPEVRPPLRRPPLPRQADLRVRRDAERQPARHARPQHLPRHL